MCAVEYIAIRDKHHTSIPKGFVLDVVIDPIKNTAALSDIDPENFRILDIGFFVTANQDIDTRLIKFMIFAAYFFHLFRGKAMTFPDQPKRSIFKKSASPLGAKIRMLKGSGSRITVMLLNKWASQLSKRGYLEVPPGHLSPARLTYSIVIYT